MGDSAIPLVQVVRLSTVPVDWVRWVCRLISQAQEGRGSPVDANGRYGGSLEIIVTKI